jgi:Immunoglobulin I-set domain
MKKTLYIAVIGGALLSVVPFASAVNIYTNDWGTVTGGSAVTGDGVNGPALVGWTVIANRRGNGSPVGPYYGIYATTGANDPVLGLGLPVNTSYLTGLGGNSTNQLGGPAMLYTTDTSGSGSGGDSAYADIDPTLYTNLTFNVEVENSGGNCPTYWAVRVGGSWYVATNNPFSNVTVGYPAFTNWSMVYDPTAANWNTLTLNTTYVTIGPMAAANLSGPITGIGIVEATNTVPGGNNGMNFNRIVINQGSGDFPHAPPVNSAPAVTPQYVYVGGGASFLSTFAGTPTLVYQWQTNGVNLSGGRYSGTTSNTLTITNCNLNDASPTYSVVVTNFFGKATNSNLQLIVTSVPSGLLYAETFPYVGPNGNLPITGVGWLSAAPISTVVGIYSAGPGLGDVFSYSPVATTNAYYTTDTNDIGVSGLPFVDINPANYPAISFQAGFVPGNAAGQVSGAISVYWAVKMPSGWYCSAHPQAIDLSMLSPYNTYQYGFNTAATNWNNLTISSSNAVIGGQAASALTGDIIGAGLVIAHNDASGSDMNFQNFEIITNQAVGAPPSIGQNYPLDVSVASGGGASFGVSANGTPPFTYSWTTNGVFVSNGGRISGATTATLTIANLNANDSGLQIVAYVTNSAGGDNSTLSADGGPTTLTVTNPPVGLVYSEAFPFVGPAAGNYPISSAGWVEAVPNSPDALYQTGTPGTSSASQGAVFAYLGSVGTTVYYATTTSDTNQAGLPFPNIDLAAYPNLNISVDIAPSFSSSNVTAYLAVQLNGTNWYVAAKPLPVPTSADSPTFSTYTAAFDPAAANWKNLTVTSSGGIIGSSAASNLRGVMTGAGLAFVTAGSGGTFNFGNFQITDLGVVGGVNAGPLTGGRINLSWVGNPAVKLQSSTNLSSSLYWQDVPDTYGLYSMPVSAAGPQKFFRLKTP